jgi:TRAP-type C4-dicarboxylate transport system permease small subunit
MNTFTNAITRILSVTLILLMAAMVFAVIWQVFTRYVLGDPSGFTEELAGFLLIWIGLLGSSYAYYTKAHLGIDILTANLSGKKRKLSEILVSAIVFLFALFLLVIGGFHLVRITFTLKQISPAMEIPMGYIYLVLPISGLLFMYYAVVFVFNCSRRNQAKS